MKNLFCIPRNDLVQLFFKESSEEKVDALLKEFSGKYSKEEILLGIATQKGEVGDYYKLQNKKHSTNSAIVEIINAVTLADLYFLESEPTICFEMKADFKQKELKSYHELIDNLESNTEIDCQIKDTERSFKFQLKQYPEEYKEWSAEKVITYIENDILPKYNNDGNKDLIIVITIQPKEDSNFKESDFKVINDFLNTKGDSIKLAEVDFLYNRNIEHIIWHQVFPKHGHYKIAWDKLSYHKAKR